MRKIDYVIIILILIIAAVLFKIWQKTKAIIPPTQIPIDGKTRYATFMPAHSDKPYKEKKVKPKQKHNRIIKLLKEMDSPMTSKQIHAGYNSKHKTLSISDIKYLLNWITKNNLLEVEELEGGDQYYGLPEWFENSELIEEYFNKISQ